MDGENLLSISHHLFPVFTCKNRIMLSVSASLLKQLDLAQSFNICTNPLPRLLQVAQTASFQPPTTPYSRVGSLAPHTISFLSFSSLPTRNPQAFLPVPFASSEQSLSTLPTAEPVAPVQAPAPAPHSHLLHPCHSKRISYPGRSSNTTRAGDRTTSTTVHVVPLPQFVCAYPAAHAPSPARAAQAILSPNTPNVDGTYTDVRLPLGWEEHRMPDAYPYFVDHHTHDNAE